MGAFFIASMSMFTSCKDYDDDINDLQAQIDKAALASDVDALKTQLTSINTAATTAQTTAENALKAANDATTAINAVKAVADKNATDVATAITNAAAAQKSADEAAAAAAAAQKTADQAIKDAAAAQGDATAALTRIGNLEATAVTTAQLNKALDDLKASIAASETVKGLKLQFDALKASVEELYSAVTSVELFGTYSGAGSIFQSNLVNKTGIALNMMHGLVGEDSKFGDNEAYKASDPIIAYVKGHDITTDGGVIIRVNPGNADLTKANIVLINSKGEVLDNVVAGTPEKYDELITRSANTIETGLWKIPFTVAGGKNLDKKTFDEAVQSNGREILYAVAVNNTKGDSARYVSSTWDIAPNYKDYVPASTFDFKVDNKFAEEIHNRWTGDKTSTEDAQKDDESIKEYTWATSTDKYPTPATAIDKDKQNIVADANDARYGMSLLPVEVNKEFVLQIADQANATTSTADKIDYYYVTLDKQSAIESVPSEWNAWTNYTYEGLFKTVKAGEKLSLKVTSDAANGDIIGFRVYAVNYDGTLADPDGRAFYVQVGEAANTENVSGDIKVSTDNAQITTASDLVSTDGKTVAPNTVVIPLTKSFQSCTDKVSGELVLNESAKDNISDKVYYQLLKKDKKPATNWKDAKYVAVGVNNAGKWKDASTVSGTVQAYNETQTTSGTTITRLANTLNISVSKVLPTSSNVTLEFRPTQGNQATGEFTLYMVPGSDPTAKTTWAVAAKPYTEGSIDLDNTFYNLPENIIFTFDKAKTENKKDVDNTTDDKNVLVEAVKYIDSETWHAVTAAINYGKISSETKDADGNLANYTVKLNQSLKARFACWATANTYAWGQKDSGKKDKDGKPIMVTKQPSFVWNHAGTYAETDIANDIHVSNSYDADRFSGDLDNLIGTNKYFTIKSATLKYGNQVNPYIEPTISGTKLTWKATQVENAVTADHEEVLELVLVDCYGHENVVNNLKVWIKKPAEK